MLELLVPILQDKKQGHPNLEFASTEKCEKLCHEEVGTSTGRKPSMTE